MGALNALAVAMPPHNTRVRHKVAMSKINPNTGSPKRNRGHTQEGKIQNKGLTV